MSDISITDQVHLTGSVEVPDDSPLAKANLKNLNFSSLPVVHDFGKPVDRFAFDSVTLGVGLGYPGKPSALTGDKISLGAGLSAVFSIATPKGKTLFGDDQFSPAIPIDQGECWAGLSIATTLTESAKFQVAGVGVSVSTQDAISFGTFVHFPTPGSQVPTFKEGLAAVLANYSVPVTPEQIRSTPAGLAHTTEITGTISLGSSYSAPLVLNPLATLDLPINLSLRIAPAATASVKASIALEGSFIIRTYRSSPSKLMFGAYKKKATVLTAKLSASAGLEAEVDHDDIFAMVLNAVVPAADLSTLQLDESQTAQLRTGLKTCVDQSVSIAVNAVCSASAADEAAVVYELDLSAEDMSKTDMAIGAALHGDWSAFETLPNAHQVRHVVRELREHNHKLTLNLLGLYNAATISDYIKSTTVVHDEHGQIALVDQATAKKISVTTTPYAAKAEKLRSAFAQAFVATVTYGAVAGKFGMSTFTVRQSFMEYKAQANCSDLTRQILLARAVNLSLDSSWDAIQKSGLLFNQSKCCVDVRYDLNAVMQLFYQDVANRTPRTPSAIDRIGRDTKIMLLDPSATNARQRRMALDNDDIWNAMNNSGNTANFKSIPGIAKLDPTAIGAITADWTDIRWWSDALQKIAPKLSAVLTATKAQFPAAHKNLENVLENLAAKTQSAFADGWELAVMYSLATSATRSAAPSVEMDIGWNKKFEHYASEETLAQGKTSGA